MYRMLVPHCWQRHVNRKVEQWVEEFQDEIAAGEELARREAARLERLRDKIADRRRRAAQSTAPILSLKWRKVPKAEMKVVRRPRNFVKLEVKQETASSVTSAVSAATVLRKDDTHKSIELHNIQRHIPDEYRAGIERMMSAPILELTPERPVAERPAVFSTQKHNDKLAFRRKASQIFSEPTTAPCSSSTWTRKLRRCIMASVAADTLLDPPNDSGDGDAETELDSD